MSLLNQKGDSLGTKRCPGCGKIKGNSRRGHKIRPGLCDSCLELKKAGKKKK